MAFPAGWTWKCKLTIQASKVDSDLTNFPVLLNKENLPSQIMDADGTGPALEGGGDIRFSSDAAGVTRLSCEVVSFVRNNTPANAVVEIHVKIPSVSSSSNTTFYVWWGKSGETQPAVDAAYGARDVWSNAYSAVFHYGSTIDDSVAGLTGTNSGTTEDTSVFKIGKSSRKFVSSSSQYINYGNTGGVNISGNNPITLQAWVRFASITGGNQDYFCKGDHQYCLQKADHLWFFIYDGGWKVAEASSFVLAKDTWYSTVGTYTGVNGGAVELWVNGNKETITSTATSISASSANFHAGDNSEEGGRFLNGFLDESRISTTVRSSGWITSEYNNQNDPGTFIIEGSPQRSGLKGYIMFNDPAIV